MHVHDTIYGISADSTDANDLARVAEGQDDWLPAGDITVGITAGASCPNNLIEDTLRRLFELRGISVQELLKK